MDHGDHRRHTGDYKYVTTFLEETYSFVKSASKKYFMRRSYQWRWVRKGFANPTFFKAISKFCNNNKLLVLWSSGEASHILGPLDSFASIHELVHSVYATVRSVSNQALTEKK